MNKRIGYRKIKKDYQNKNLSNPFFNRNKKGKRSLPKYTLALIVLAVIAVIWFFFASETWNLKKIEITGLTRSSHQKAEEIIYHQAGQKKLLFFKELNIFLLDVDSIKTQIMEEYSLIDVVVDKKLPDTLKISVQERPYAFIFEENGLSFHASVDAYIIREPLVTPDDYAKYFVVQNQTDRSFIGVKDRLDIRENYINFILSLGNQLYDNPELPLEKIIIDQEFNMATAKLAGGPAVYFNVNEDVAAQIERLLLVKNEKIKDNFSKTNYIDLRYGDRIFINPDFR